MKNSLKNALEIKNAGGAVAASDWTTGSGRHTTRRNTPVFCHEIQSDDIKSLKGFGRNAAIKLKSKRPRVQTLIVLTDFRGFNKAVKKTGGKA